MTIYIEENESGCQLFIDHEQITGRVGIIDVLREIIKQHGLDEEFEIKEK